MKSLNGDQTVIYSAHVVKLGRNMKTADRAFVLTDKHLYRLDGVTYQTGKKAPIVLKQIGSVSLLPGNDQGMIIHTKVRCHVHLFEYLFACMLDVCKYVFHVLVCLHV